MSDKGDVKAGSYYVKVGDGPLVDVNDVTPAGRVPDAVMCRRVRDFPNGRAPRGARIARCMGCGDFVAFNPETFPDAPRRCMQCCAVRPLPLPMEP